MISLVNVAAALLWVVVITRIPTLRRQTTQRLLWAALATLAAAVTLEIPDISRWLAEQPGGGSNAGHLIKHALVVSAAVVAREVVRELALPPDIARRGMTRRGAGMVAMLAILGILFAAAPVHGQALPGLTAVAVREPVLLAYWAIYLFALGSALISIARLAFSSVVAFPSGPLRTSMAWLAAGAMIGLTYCVHKAIYLVVSTITDGSWPPSEAMDTVQQLLLALTVMIFVVGVLWPACAQWPMVRHLRAYRAYRRLYPLWLAYYQAEPEIALDASTSARRGVVPLVHDIELDLYRRVIEIRDGMLAVRRFASPRVRDLAIREARMAGHGASAELIGEAAWLELARRSKLRGDRPHNEAMPAPTGGKDVPSEIMLLTEIAAARKGIRNIVGRVEALIGAAP